MVPPGPPTSLNGAQSVPSSMLRSNSGLLGDQGGNQSGFPSLVSPRTQFNNMNVLGNVSSLLHQSYGNGGTNSGSSIRGMIDNGPDSDPLSSIGNGMGFNAPSSSLGPSNMVNSNAPGQHFSNSSPNLQQSQQYSVTNNNIQQQQQYQTSQVKMEQQAVTNESNSQQMQALRNLGQVKMEPQAVQQTIRNFPTVKMEPQHSDQSLFLQQQQQQQQLLQMSRQSPQSSAAQINLLHQQRFLQLQHQQQQQQQQQQQLLKNIPQQRSSLQPQFQQATRSPAKPVHEPGMCARRLTHYMYQQQHRPEDNNIEFWRKFVAEYFAPNARKKWCVSLYGNGRHTTGVFPQDVWHCEICNKKPGRGFEATAEVLPRLFKIKYESGTLEELLYVDMPREYQNSSGQIVLDYAKAIQESVFEQLRVVRDGQLRIVFSADLKICSWEFCARRHEELIPRRLLIPQVSQLANAAQKYQASTQNASSSVSQPELQNNCNMFVASARQLTKALEVPLVNDLGYTKRYVRCLQISEVVNSMKDLIDFSRETRTGPMESLAKFPRRTSSTSSFHNQSQQPEEQQKHPQPTSAMQITSTNGALPCVNNINSSLPTSSNTTIASLLHQNSMNSRHQNPLSNTNSPSPLPVTSPNIPMTDADAIDSQSSVQKIIQEMMSSHGGNGGGGVGSMGTDMKSSNDLVQVGNNGSSGVVGNGHMGMRGAMGQHNSSNNSLSMNGRVAMQMNMMQQDLGSQLLNGLGAVNNGFNNMPFDWKPSP
ncbi:transcriptional corepressor SEUSS-like [Bidens hawaiensis]|uniref:transcriptional corepressor SEUSS-like n=1 Tax=Bidens hawaiensis TaxID=980011 RepID=UPI00404AAEBC